MKRKARKQLLNRIFILISVIAFLGLKSSVSFAAPTGDGMLIYDSDDANAENPHYRTWTPSDLSAEADMLSDDQGTNTEDINHVVVRSSSARNEYIRGALTELGELDVQIFDGSNWSLGSNAPANGRFTTGIGRTNDVMRGFDIAYEASSGDALVVYENSTTADTELKYRTWDGSAWSAEGSIDYSAVDEGNDVATWIELDKRGGGNEIMLGFYTDSGNAIYAGVWDGSTWQDLALINGTGVNVVQQPFDVTWEGTSDQGMIVYGTGTTTDYSVYDISAGTWTDGASSVNPGEAVNWLRLDGDANSDYIALITTSGNSTSTSDVAVDIWNGSDWTTVSTPTDDTDVNSYGFSAGADVAWESTGDRALFVWKDGTTAETSLRYMVYDISANQFQAIDDNVVCLLTEGGAGTTEQVTSLANAEDSAGPCSGLGTWAGTVSGLRAAADPSSSAIMILGQNETTLDIRPEAQFWNGDANGSWLTQTATMGALETDLSPGALPTAANPYRAYDFVFRSNSADGTGIFVYDEDGANFDQPPHYRTWSGTDFSAEGNLLDNYASYGSEAYFEVVRAAPTRNEYMAGRQTRDGHVNIQMWDGDSWELGSNAATNGAVSTGIGQTNAGNRAFDISYEQQSGDAMVVYEDSSTADKTLKYRTWNGSAWSSEGTLDYSVVAEGGSNDVTVWVELESRGAGNEIMLGWQDKTGLGYYAAVWDGGTWQDITLINGAGVSINQESFDIEWEATSDQGMIVYGTGTTTDHSVYDISAGTWTDGASSINPGEAVNWLRLDSDPSSDYIALITVSGNSTSASDAAVDMWNGSDWTTVTTPSDDTDINTYGFAQAAAVAWEQNNAGGRALFVWRDGTTDELSLRYMVYDRTANQFQAIDDNVVCLLTEGGAGTTEQVTSLANIEDSGGPCSGLGSWPGTVSGIIAASDPSSNIIAVLAENQTVLDIKPEMQLWNGDGTWLSQTANMGAFEPDDAPGVLPTGVISNKAYSFVFNKSDASSTPSTYVQETFRWYVDSDAEDVTDPWSSFSGVDIAENTSVAIIPARFDPPSASQELHLRVNISVNDAPITSSTVYFKLQYRTGTDADCSSGSWTDVGTGDWTYATSSVTDGTTLSTARITGTDVLEAYSKSNPVGNPNGTSAAGDIIEYGFHIIGSAASENTRYLFRVVETDSGGTASTAFSGYTNCAILTTEPGTADIMRHGNLFSEGEELGQFWTD